MSGSWKVAYADFVTAMMAFFLLMWILNAAPEETKAGISTYFTEGGMPEADGVTMVSGPNPRLERVEAFSLGEGFSEIEKTHEDIAEELEAFTQQEDPTNKTSNVSFTSTGVLLNLTANAMFEPDSVTISAEGWKTLGEVLAILHKYNVYLLVRGHTSTDESGAPNFASTWELSSARATTVVEALVGQGINPSYLKAVAYADTKPVLPDSDPNAQVSNRRVEFYFYRPEVPAIVAGY